jgi:hypothetical protein
VRRALQQGCVRLAIGRPVHGQRLRSLDDTAADEVAQGIGKRSGVEGRHVAQASWNCGEY